MNAAASCTETFPVEAEQRTRVDREHGAAERVIPRKSIAKLEGKAQHPLPNRGTREYVVVEVRGTLGHPSAAAA